MRMRPSSRSGRCVLPASFAPTVAESEVNFAEIEGMDVSHGALHEDVADHFGADRGRADGLNPEFAVHLPARRIVDAATMRLILNMRWAMSAAMMLRLSPSVTATKPSAVCGARSLEHVVVDAGADHDVAPELRAEAFESGGIFVYDDDFVTVGVQEFRECRADAAAPHDEISHGE